MRQVLYEGHMELHLAPIVLIRLRRLEDLRDDVLVLVQLVQDRVALGQYVIAHQLYLRVVNQVY